MILTVVNSDVGNDAEVLEHDRGRRGQHDVSDTRAPVMLNAGHHARGWILAAATADLAQGIARVQETLTTP